ncbi:hypothetical protein AQJ46_11880 [Streptomyces canus]|uniref:Uncharacterized protein n=1 Tax=Streptomyces canus TaxID=58343 RepID=A0A101SEM2_9ACTN|nr:hypothetical protein AQJ46_11880 [Streptomyces canus]
MAASAHGVDGETAAEGSLLPCTDRRRVAIVGHTRRARSPEAGTFLLLATAFTLNDFAMYAVVFSLVPLMTERGAGPMVAAWALGLGGTGQTLGCMLYARLTR